MPNPPAQSDSPSVPFVIGAGSLLLLLLAGFIVSFLLLHQKRQLQHRREKEALGEAFAAEVLRAQVEIGEQTLLRVSQEIHDNFGQLLSLAKLHLNLLARTVDAPTADKLREAIDLVGRTLTELRDLSKTMDAGYALAQGLAPALAFQLQLIEKMGTHHTSLRVEGEERRLDAQREVILFRIVQELLNNSLKHAQASTLTLSLSFTEQALILALQDDGVGFAAGTTQALPPGEKGSGLGNMQRRATLVGARFDLTSQPGSGTIAQLRVPYTPLT